MNLGIYFIKCNSNSPALAISWIEAFNYNISKNLEDRL